MRAKTNIMSSLLFATTAIATVTTPALAQLRSTAPVGPAVRLPMPPAGTPIPVTRSCNRPLERRGRMIRAFIQSYDSTSGWLVISAGPSTAQSVRMFPFPQPVFQASACVPIESNDGHRETLAALLPEKFIVIWVSDIVMPTQPPQFIMMGIEVFDTPPRDR